MHFWCHDTTLKKIFSIGKLNLVGWGETLHCPPPKKKVENFKPLVWLSSPKGSWKLNIPQGPIKLSPHLPGGGRIPWEIVTTVGQNCLAFRCFPWCFVFFENISFRKQCKYAMNVEVAHIGGALYRFLQ